MLSKLSVKKPYTVIVGVVLIIILGFVSFTEMTTDLFPSIDFPYAVVMTPYGGASPEQVEQVVTRPIEQSMATVNNIKNINSISKENVSIVMLEFDDSADMNAISIDLREKLDMISSYWDDSVGSPTIMKLNPDMMPIMVAAVDVDGMSQAQIAKYVEDKVVPKLESIEGVASVSSQGVIEESVNVILNSNKIDKINGQLQEEVGSHLDEAKDKMEDASKELKTNKKKLYEQTDAFYEGVTSGENTIKEAKEELLKNEIILQTTKNGIVEKETYVKLLKDAILKQEKTVAQLEKELNSEETQQAKKLLYNSYAEAKKTVEEVDKNLASLYQTKDSLNKKLEAIRVDSSLTEEQKEVQLAEISKQLSETEIAIKTLETTKQTIAPQVESLEKNIAELEEKELTLTSAKKVLEETRKEIEELESTLASSKKELEDAEKKMQEGKYLLKQKEESLTQKKEEVGTQLGDASSKLDEGEIQLNEKLEEFEQQKTDALTNADVESYLTIEMISNILAAQNFSMPAGYITEEGTEYLVRVGDKIADLEELKNLVLFDMKIEGVAPIRLLDVADVFATDNSDEIYAKVNGNDAIILSMQKQTNYATAEVSDKIKATFDELKENETNLHATYLMDQGMYIDLVVDSVLDNLIFGGILAIIILFIFLHDIRPTFIIACSIPISVMFAIVLMYFSGVTLNIISLSGLAVGVGMLVDNSVVVIENTYRLRSKGYSAVKAAVSGAIQVGGAITASTLTTICVFLPIVFVEGITRQLFVDMALTIGYSLGASLIVALTLVPMMSSTMLKKSVEKKHSFFDRIVAGYERLLRLSLRFKPIVLVVAVVLLILSVVASISRGFVYMPSMDSTQISVNLQMPTGSEYEDTVAMADIVVERMEQMEDVESVGAMMTTSSMLDNSTKKDAVSMYVILKENKKSSSEEIAAQIEKQCEDLTCEITASGSSMDMSALGGEGIAIHVKGNDLDILKRTADEVSKIVSSIEGTVEVSNGVEEPANEIRIQIDKEKAMKEGLTVASAYMDLNKALSASNKATTLSFTDGTEFPVIVQQQGSKGVTRESLKDYKFEVTTKTGETKTIKLSDIAVVSEAEGLSTINREAQQRYLTVSAKIKEGYNVSLVTQKVEEACKEYQVPNGFELSFEGENETIMESMEQLLKMLLLGIVCIYLIMVAQFQSLLSPFIVLFTIPLAFTGGFLGLLVSGNELSVIAMIGFIMLAGIIVNNGIVLVDYINQLRLDGVDKREAILEAGKTRLRPILMTALTTVLGLSTMALGIGTGADMVQPIAIVTIGGLLYATLMTLFVVPVMYDLLHRKKLQKIKAEELEVIED